MPGAPLRILFTSHYALPHHGGIEVVIDQLARALVARGHRVTHLASNIGFDAAFSRPYNVIPVAASNLLERRAGVPVPLFHPRLLTAVRSALQDADVLHAHGFLYPSSVAALLAARAMGARSPARILTEHVGHVHYASRLVKAVETIAIDTVGRSAVRSAEAGIVFNTRVEAELRALAPRVELHWIANGVDADRYHPPAAGERARLRAELAWNDRPKVLFVGRLVAKKGIDLALATIRQLPEADLVIVGPGTPPVDLPANVLVLGPLPADRVAQLYRAADAFLLPSQGEGFPLTVQEAMASGLPAVVLDDPGYAHEANTPLLHRSRPDAAELARVLREIVGKPPPSAATSARSWPVVAEEHEQLYRTVLASRTLPHRL